MTKRTTLTEKILAYRKNHTLEECGKEFSLTSERIRQIVQIKHRRRCLIHNRYFYNKCSYCLDHKSYRKYIDGLEYVSLIMEVAKESENKKRDFTSTMHRAYLIKVLVEKYEYSLTYIALLLKKDYSTINYLYTNYAN